MPAFDRTVTGGRWGLSTGMPPVPYRIHSPTLKWGLVHVDGVAARVLVTYEMPSVDARIRKGSTTYARHS